jgi:hypothetical protein
MTEGPVRPPNKILILLRRLVAIFLGILFFAMVVPEFSGMGILEIVVWMIIPLAPILFVYVGCGRNRAVESIGWGLFAIIGLVFCMA